MRRSVLPKAMFGLLVALGGCDNTTPRFEAGVSADGSIDGAAEETSVAVCTDDGGAEEAIPELRIYTPEWAFEPWISKDISSTQDTYDFVNGFQQRDIPVGVVVLDSPWETNYNTFVPNPTRYPRFEMLVQDLHARGIRVVLWTTQMVNRQSFDAEPGGDTYAGPAENFAQALGCGYFVNDGRTYGWWKGVGAAIDFFNPRATAWWHRQQDRVLAMGIDGWKLDFGESYITGATIRTARGEVSPQQYSEAYYRDFYAYGQHRRGRSFLTMVRGWDESYQFQGRFFARKEHAPVVWAGDNRRDFRGLIDALDTTFRSARAGYVVVGSDIGGYLDFDDRDRSAVPADQEAFARWTAVGAMMPFMQLHGRANLAPWTVTPRTEDTVALYRYWSKLHHELVPFFYSLAQESYANNGTIVRPIGEPASWAGDYRYQLGDAFLVAPLLEAGGRRNVELPSGARWFDWWRPFQAPRDGGSIAFSYDATDQQHLPLFVREGAIIPARVSDGYTGLGDSGSGGRLTLLVYPGPTRTRFVLHEERRPAPVTIETVRENTGIQIVLPALTQAVVLRVRSETPPTAVTVNGTAIPMVASRVLLNGMEQGFFYDETMKFFWVRLPMGAARTVSAMVAP